MKLPPCNVPKYDVHYHALRDIAGEWLRYRHHGWCAYPMQIKKPYEKGLHMARFRLFSEDEQSHVISIPYRDPNDADDTFFEEIVTWIGLRDSQWSFRIDNGGRLAERKVHFSFADPIVAVEFKLRWS